MKKTTTKPKKVKDAPITDKDIKEAVKVLSNAKVITPKEKPISIPSKLETRLKSGTCIFCNDSVTKEPAVYDHACHSECATMQGDKKIRERIKELRNG